MTCTCRFCNEPLSTTMVDLGMSPIANAYLPPEQLNSMEKFYPLKVFVCNQCFLAQLEEFESPDEIFSEYSYFSSFSDSWLAHAKRFVTEIIPELSLTAQSSVIELASNDGYLLQYFKAAGIPVLGVEPAHNVAKVAIEKGIPTRSSFFSREFALQLRSEGVQADLLIGNNVYAHVPDINSFTAGIASMLAPEGVVSLEFPHLCELMKNNQFDTIYHEHFSYLSLISVEKIFTAHGLKVLDVKQIPTHGGSLRVTGCLAKSNRTPQPSVQHVIQQERAAGLDRLETYTAFEKQVNETKRALLSWLIAAKNEGKTIAAYGAAAKGVTLLNFCGIRGDFLDYVVDRSPYKQGKSIPGVHIPIFGPEKISETKPDLVLILPWNLREEVSQQLSFIRDWGGKFLVPIPRVEQF